MPLPAAAYREADTLAASFVQDRRAITPERKVIRQLALAVELLLLDAERREASQPTHTGAAIQAGQAALQAIERLRK